MNENDRRKALKILAGVSPVVWAKPVISTAVIPAHAAASGFGDCSVVNFEAGSDESTEVGNVEIEFETLDSSVNGLTWEAQFSSESAMSILDPIGGTIEDGNGSYSNPENNVVSFESEPAVGKELTVNILWEGGLCIAETTVYDDPD